MADCKGQGQSAEVSVCGSVEVCVCINVSRSACVCMCVRLYWSVWGHSVKARVDILVAAVIIAGCSRVIFPLCGAVMFIQRRCEKGRWTSEQMRVRFMV